MSGPEGQSPNPQEGWPPAGSVEVGSYAFSEPFVPTLQQVEDAETFVFTRREFLKVSDEIRARNVIRLAFAAAFCQRHLDEVDGMTSIIPLTGDLVAVVESVVYEGSVVSRYYTVEEYQEMNSES